MRVEVETLESTQVRLVIEIPAEEVNDALHDAVHELRGYVSFPGFRKGRVPLAILKSRFPDHINSEVLRQLVLPAYEDALFEKKLIPLAQPVFDPPLEQLKVVENESLVIAAIVNIKPEISLPDYEEIEIDKTAVNVPREDVEAHIERLQFHAATFEPIEEDRPVEASDCVRVDWECTLDGQILEDEDAYDLDVDLTSTELNADLKAGLLGMKVGETKEISVSYDSSYPAKNLAGKQVIYEVSLHAITLKHLPELDDEFAKDLGYETFNQMHGVIWNNLVENERIVQEEKQKNEILEQLIDRVDITIPDDLIEQFVQQTLEKVQKQLISKQQTPEEAGINLETLPTELRADVIKQTKQNWIFDEIAEYEGIYVSDEELELAIRRAAEQSNRDTYKYADLLKASNQLEDFRLRLQHEKIYQFLIEEVGEKRSLIITG